MNVVGLNQPINGIPTAPSFKYAWISIGNTDIKKQLKKPA